MKRTALASLVSLVSLALAAGVLGAPAPRTAFAADEADVPSLLGKSQDEALALLATAGLTGSPTAADEPSVSLGTVVAQSPAAGGRLLRGGTVELRVARGAEARGEALDAAVPYLLKHDRFALAEDLLLANGFLPRARFEVDPRVTEGRVPAFAVLDQRVRAGTMAEPGTKIGLTVARAETWPSRIPVPSVYGLTEEEARRTLESAGLVLAVAPAPSLLPSGSLFGQTPSAGKEAAPGADVRAFEAVAPDATHAADAVAVPLAIGRERERAHLLAIVNGLRPVLRHVEAPEGKADVVLAQDPAPGGAARRGAALVLYVPRTATVPDVVKRSRFEAQAMLDAAGLRADFEGPADAAGAVVSDLSPAARAAAPPGGRARPRRWAPPAPPPPPRGGGAPGGGPGGGRRGGRRRPPRRRPGPTRAPREESRGRRTRAPGARPIRRRRLPLRRPRTIPRLLRRRPPSRGRPIRARAGPRAGPLLRTRARAVPLAA